MRTKTLAWIGVSLAGLIAAAAWAQVSIRPGLYAITVETTEPGDPTPSRHEDTDCYTPEESRDLAKAMVSMLASEDACEAANVKESGNKLTFDIVCEFEGTRATSRSEVVTAGDSMTAVSTTSFEGVTSTTKFAAKWIGATCTEEEDDE